MSELFLNKEFIAKEFAQHIPFDMVHDTHLVCKTWSNLVSIDMYIQSVISSSPTKQELEEYKNNGGSFKFNSQVRLTITRGRYYLVENFMTEDEFEILYYEKIYGAYKAVKAHGLNEILMYEYNVNLIIRVVNNELSCFNNTKDIPSRALYVVDIITFFLKTVYGEKFMKRYPKFRHSVIKKEVELKKADCWGPIIEERFAVMKEVYGE